MDPFRRVLKGGAVLIEEGVVAGLFAAGEERPPDRSVLDARHGIVIPGLVNLHGHAAMSLMRGLADDLPLMTWLREHIFPAEARFVDADFVYWGTRLAATEMLLGGTTTMTDMYYFPDAAARAVSEIGIRAAMGPTVIGFPAPDAATPEEALDRAEGFVRRWGSHPRIAPSLSAHALYTTPSKWIRRAARKAGELGAVFQIHAAEDPTENERARADSGAGVLRSLEALRVLRPGAVLAHGIYFSDEDLERIRASGAGIAHNPESNMKLGIPKAAPVAKALAMGIPVGLGTDGPVSNNDLDLFGEMDTAAKLHKFVSGDPTALPAKDVFQMATIEGARALRLDGIIGSLEAGKRADIVVVDARRPSLAPLHSVYSHLVYAAKPGDVSHVFVDGRMVVEEGRVLTVDEAETLEVAERYGRKLRR